jgi:hypothetical protein
VTRRRWPLLGGATVLATTAVEIVFHDAAHTLYWWHEVPAFDLALGLAGTAAIVAVSKTFGAWLLRPAAGDEDSTG